MSKPCGYYTQEKCFEEASKYKTKKDFRAAVPSAYYAAQRHGWLKDYTWFIRPDMAQKWTKEACYNEAKKYKTIKDFRDNNENCFMSAWRKGWVREYTWLEKSNGGYIIWTQETCYNEAKKYTTMHDFRTNSVGAYSAASKHKWLKEYTWLKRETSEPYTFEYFSETIKKYKTLKDFRENEKALYSAAKKNKWLKTDEFKSLMRLNKPDGYWTKERCKEEAFKYKTLSDFINNAPSAYHSAWRNRWLSEITSHMKTRISSENEYRHKHVIYVYKDEINHYVYVGLTNNMYVRDTSHRDKNKQDTLYKHFSKYGLNIPKPEIIYYDLTPHEAQEKEREVYYQYRDAGWNMINHEKALGSLGSIKKKWTYIKTYKEAQKYKYPIDFKNNSSGAYSAACRNGWLKDYTWL